MWLREDGSTTFTYTSIFLKKYFIYLLIFRESGREGEKEGEKHQCEREISIGCLSYTPWLGLNLQPRCVPWLGNEWATFCFAGWHQTSRAMLVRATLPCWLEAKMFLLTHPMWNLHLLKYTSLITLRPWSPNRCAKVLYHFPLQGILLPNQIWLPLWRRGDHRERNPNFELYR